MLSYASPSALRIIRKYAYFLAYIPLCLPILGLYLGRQVEQVNLYSYFTLFVLYLILPALDYIIGKDNMNLNEQTEIPELNKSWFYRILPVLSVIGFSSLIIWAAYMAAYEPGLNIWGQIGLVLSIGTISGYVGINVSHELIHRKSKWEQSLGGFALAMVCYGGFKIEHIRGHHVNVATPKDASSSRYDEDLYSFLPKCLVSNWLSAWRLEKELLQSQGRGAWSIYNELIWWNVVSACVVMVCALSFGIIGVIVFLGQSMIAVLSLEVVNYIQHYGLHRRTLDNGRFERVTPFHSWNSSYFLSNAILFQLQRHSDHHANPTRPYQSLRSFAKSPQMPFGLPLMIMLAFAPPLWRKLMNPRVQTYYKGEEQHLLSPAVA